MADNGFNSTVQALFKGLEGFLTTKNGSRRCSEI